MLTFMKMTTLNDNGRKGTVPLRSKVTEMTAKETGSNAGATGACALYGYENEPKRTVPLGSGPFWVERPEIVGRAVGFADMTSLHGEWIRTMAFGDGDLPCRRTGEALRVRAWRWLSL